MDKYRCTDPLCEYCYKTQKPVSRQIPLLPQPYQNLLTKNGGYYMFRDLVLLENSKLFNGDELRKVKQNINRRIKITRRRQNILA